ncbi:acyltransferase family protein [Halioxenophilus aromaticivorans]|uniref:Acyltransferase n=1 Tax=Halioxenophilus aromaticivorans TaxID=1306992 RepID=A0AAV3U182_9ALTE
MLSVFKGRNRELDFLRGIAILLAMGWHINGISVDSNVTKLILLPGKEIGWVGVDIFFVLSGFLVGGMIIREIDRKNGFGIKTFYVRRIFRLWPILYTFLIAMAVARPTELSTFLPQVALHVQNYWHTGIAVHLWSLAVEEHFYVLLSILIYTVAANREKVVRLPYWMAGLVMVSLIFRVVGALNDVDSRDLQGQTHYRLDGLSIGVILAYYAHHKPDLIRQFQSQKWLLWPVLFLSVCFVAIVPKSSFIGSTIGYSISALGSAAALLLVYKSGFTKRIPTISLIVAYIGIISYPLYLWHVPVAKAMEIILNDYLSPTALVFSIYLTSIIISSFLTHLLEKPFMRLRDNLFPAKAHPEVDIEIPLAK